MEILNSFSVPLPVDEAWKTLRDIRKIVPCMPGAELLEMVDPQTYKGRVSVRLGPVALSFVGTAKFEETDDVAHRASVKAQGTDSKGRGGATGVITFGLSPQGAATQVDVKTNVNLSGAVAQYGRGVGMIQDVATQIVGQFATSLRTMLEHDNAIASAAKEGISPAFASPPSPSQPSPISGFSLMARVMMNAIRRLFGGN